MCLHITRSCPSCRTATEYVENHNCDKVPTCPNVESSSLPLRRENFSTWDCPTRKCSFNTGYLRNLERKHVLARVAQIEGYPYTLDSSLTPDERLMVEEDSTNDKAVDDSGEDEAASSYNEENDEDDDEAAAANANPPPPQQQRSRRVRAIGRVNEDGLPHEVRQRIQQLRAAIAAERPAPPRFARRAAPRRKSEMWIPEEDELLLLLRDNRMGYSQIEEYFSWRNRNPLEHRVSTLKKNRARAREAAAAQEEDGDESPSLAGQTRTGEPLRIPRPLFKPRYSWAG